MKGILYRPVEQKDYAVIGEIINEAFGLYRYVPHPKLLENVKQQYVYSCFQKLLILVWQNKTVKLLALLWGTPSLIINFFVIYLLYAVQLGTASS